MTDSKLANMRFLKLAQQWAPAHKRVVIAAVAGIVLIALAITGSTFYNGEQHRLAVVVAAEQAAEDKAAEERAEVKRLAANLRAAGVDAENSIAKADAFLVDAAARAEAEALANVAEQRETLIALHGSDDAVKLALAARNVVYAITSAGTVEDSRDRQYVAAREASGKAGVSDDDSLVRIAKAYCTQLDYYKADPLGAVASIGESRPTADVLAIQFYCPQYQIAVDAAKYAVNEGTHRVAAEPSPLGTYETDIAAGTYRSGRASNCYWETARGDGSTIANDFVSAALDGVTVTLNIGETFITRGCGTWNRQ